MRRVRQAVCMAQKVGARLGEREVLQRPVPAEGQSIVRPLNLLGDAELL